MGDMQHKKTLLFSGLALVLGSSNVWPKGRKPPEDIYPIHDQQSLEQMIAKPSPSEDTAGPVTSALPADRQAPSLPIPAESEPEKAPTTLKEAVPAELPAVATPVPEAAAPPVAAVPAKSSSPASYKVWIWQENGDTLWRIAQKVYGDKDKWPLIYQANRDVIHDPNKIYPKQVLKIPPLDWQP